MHENDNWHFSRTLLPIVIQPQAVAGKAGFTDESPAQPIACARAIAIPFGIAGRPQQDLFGSRFDGILFWPGRGARRCRPNRRDRQQARREKTSPQSDHQGASDRLQEDSSHRQLLVVTFAAVLGFAQAICCAANTNQWAMLQSLSRL
jgi:hypothetical protein